MFLYIGVSPSVAGSKQRPIISAYLSISVLWSLINHHQVAVAILHLCIPIHCLTIMGVLLIDNDIQATDPDRH